MFFTFASSVWALLPLVARQLLGSGARFYGILLGAIDLVLIGLIAHRVKLPIHSI